MLRNLRPITSLLAGTALLLLGVGLVIGQDPEILAFYRSGLGQVIVAAVLGLMAAGQIVIRRMIDEVV